MRTRWMKWLSCLAVVVALVLFSGCKSTEVAPEEECDRAPLAQ